MLEANELATRMRRDRGQPPETAPDDAAIVLTKEGLGRCIPASEIVPAVLGGEVVAITRALQRIGYQQRLLETMLSAIGETCGSAQEEQCRRLGFERLHEVLNAEQMERAVQLADTRLGLLYPALMKVIGHDVLGLRRGFYIHQSSLLRILVPRHTATFDEARFRRRDNRGKLSGHGPHRDYWFRIPINAINVWMAIGPVQRENGLLIYTDMWGKEVIYDGGFAREDDALGTPVTFALQPGDIVVFDNRQLHSTVVNYSAATRIVFSGRLCVDPPIAPRAEVLGMTPSFWSPLIGTRLERFAGAATNISSAYLLERLKRRISRALGSLERRFGGYRLTPVRNKLRYRRGDRPFSA